MKYKNPPVLITIMFILLCSTSNVFAVHTGGGYVYNVALYPTTTSTSRSLIFVIRNESYIDDYGNVATPAVTVAFPTGDCVGRTSGLGNRLALNIDDLLTNPETKAKYNFLMSAIALRKPITFEGSVCGFYNNNLPMLVIDQIKPVTQSQ